MHTDCLLIPALERGGSRLQVTNPAIDPFREAVVTSLRTFIGPEGDLSAVEAEHCYRMELQHPVLTLKEIAAIKRMDYRGWHANVRSVTMVTVFNACFLFPVYFFQQAQLSSLSLHRLHSHVCGFTSLMPLLSCSFCQRPYRRRADSALISSQAASALLQGMLE